MRNYLKKKTIILISGVVIILLLLSYYIFFSPGDTKDQQNADSKNTHTKKAVTIKEYINPADGAALVFIPAGFSYIGTDRNTDPMADASETAPRLVYLDEYYIYKYEVTLGQFKKFADDTGYITTAEKKRSQYNWRNLLGELSKKHPSAFISWYDADAYSKWAGGHLPTEAQWEKAARGEGLLIYPWGNKPDNDRFNNELDGDFNKADRSQHIEDGDFILKSSKPVGSYPLGASPYGVMDMLGNVWEWCDDWYERKHVFPGKGLAVYHPRGLKDGKFKIVKGGGYCDDPANYRVTCRDRNFPDTVSDDFGFRVVIYPGSLHNKKKGDKNFSPPRGTYTDDSHPVFIDKTTKKRIN